VIQYNVEIELCNWKRIRVFAFSSSRRSRIATTVSFMWNFIDDSGSFSWGNRGKSLFCGVTVSDSELSGLENRFIAWKRSIVGNSGKELKGSDLTSNQLESFAMKVLPPSSGVMLTVVGGDTSVTAEFHSIFYNAELYVAPEVIKGGSSTVSLATAELGTTFISRTSELAGSVATITNQLLRELGYSVDLKTLRAEVERLLRLANAPYP
jgi:hypothetical protein